MIRRVRKLGNIFLTLAALAILATALVTPTSLDAQNAPPPKNLKVLTPENFMAQMQTFPVALGVENQEGCNFCHEADRSRDTKPTKVKARQSLKCRHSLFAGYRGNESKETDPACRRFETVNQVLNGTTRCRKILERHRECRDRCE
jgi:hypothetical protein